MSTIETSGITDDIRYRFVIWYLVIFIILIISSLVLCFCTKQECPILWGQFLWCLAFTIFGFWLLVVRICINNIHNLDVKKESIPKNENTETVINIKVESAINIKVDSVINKKPEDSQQTKKIKILLRYFFFYPILIIVLAVLSNFISLHQFSDLKKIQYFIASALVSFFLGFFIDSIPNLIEKAGKVISS